MVGAIPSAVCEPLTPTHVLSIIQLLVFVFKQTRASVSCAECLRGAEWWSWNLSHLWYCGAHVMPAFFTFCIKFPVSNSNSASEAMSMFQLHLFNKFVLHCFLQAKPYFCKKQEKTHCSIFSRRRQWWLFLRNNLQGRPEWQFLLFWKQTPSAFQHSSMEVWLKIDPRIVADRQVWSQHSSGPASALLFLLSCSVWYKSLWNLSRIYLFIHYLFVVQL